MILKPALWIACIFCALPLGLSAQWKHTNGPTGANISSITANSKYLFVSTDQNNLYRSPDAGAGWERIADSAPIAGALKCSDEVLAYPSGLNLLRFSTDQGKTWTSLGQTYTSFEVEGRYIYLSFNVDSISRLDAFTLTKEKFPVSTTHSAVDLVRISGGKMLLSMNYNLFVCDTGVWNLKSTGLKMNFNGAVDFYADGSNLLVWGVQQFNGAAWSDNSGDTWQGATGPVGLWQQTGVPRLVRFNDKVLLHRGKFWESSDLGHSWVESPVQTAASGGIARTKNFLFSGNSFGVYRRSADDLSFSLSAQGLIEPFTRDITFSGDYLYANTPIGLQRYNLISQAWDTEPLFRFEGNVRAYYANGDTLLVIEDNANRLRRSTDGGHTWTVDNAFSAFYPNRIFRFQDTYFIMNPGDPIWRSTNLGHTWTKVDTLLNFMTATDTALYGVYGKKIKRSPDSYTWTDIASIDSLVAGPLRDIKCLPGKIAAMSAPLNTYQFVLSGDNGSNWQKPGAGFQANYILNNIQFADMFGHIAVPGHYNSVLIFSPDLQVKEADFPLAGNYQIQQVATRGNTLFAPTNSGMLYQDIVPPQFEDFNGKVFLDANANGVQDSTESGLPGYLVQLKRGAPGYMDQYTNTGPDGAYGVSVLPGGNDTVRAVLPVPSTYYAFSPPFYVPTAGDSLQDFALQWDKDAIDLGIYGTNSGPVRPGFEFVYVLNYTNHGTLPADAVISLKFEAGMQFIQASPAPDEIFPDSLVWKVNPLGILTGGSIAIKFKPSNLIPLGTLTEFISRIGPFAGVDADSSDNRHIQRVRVLGSHDPNDKSVFPEDGLTQAEIAGGKRLTYTVRFQNTGTYAAEFVRIADKIDPALDLSTLQILGYSHPVRWSIRPDNVLEFFFDDIALPDSTADEAGSHGFISFSLEPLKTLNPGREIRNTAYIFFDFNAPVQTNTVLSKVLAPTIGTGDPGKVRTRNMLRLTPNPTPGLFTLQIPDAPSGEGLLVVCDAAGRPVTTCRIPLDQAAQLDAAAWPDGLYFVTWKMRESVWQGCLIKMK